MKSNKNNKSSKQLNPSAAENIKKAGYQQATYTDNIVLRRNESDNGRVAGIELRISPKTANKLFS